MKNDLPKNLHLHRTAILVLIVVLVLLPFQAVVFMSIRTADKLALAASALPDATAMLHQFELGRTLSGLLLASMTLDAILLIAATGIISHQFFADCRETAKPQPEPEMPFSTKPTLVLVPK